MINYLRTNPDNQDFQALIKQLDELLRIIDGDAHVFYAALNKTNQMGEVVVAYENGTAIGCGALRHYEAGAVEIKRMFVPEAFRGRGIASHILRELEAWARELTYQKCILETGNKQIAAIHLYKKNGYQIIENFGKYMGVENSVCFEKQL